MLNTTPKRSTKRYAAPELTTRGNLVDLTREPAVDGDNDGGLPPFDKYEAAGSVGFLL
jgi:hypothetical protein